MPPPPPSAPTYHMRPGQNRIQLKPRDSLTKHLLGMKGKSSGNVHLKLQCQKITLLVGQPTGGDEKAQR